ncbi:MULTISPECIES: hypothetical protein [Eikenella]|uniref:Uncharacterized protein n=1 Tax=Eikenella longinqua TaxID=1795827 RepID=A0A1A9S2P8_9NEIS|nr:MULTISPECIES: hypothetical protein [Eikenella]OAM31479.1 hypothetical protein A7P95_00130 [Eikenella longinqua]
MNISIDGDLEQAVPIVQRAADLLEVTRLDEIINELSRDSQNEIRSILLKRAEAILADEAEDERWERQRAA